MVMKDVELLNATFAALADPTRRAILARLASGEASVMELAEPFDMSQPAISKHLKVLERAGLVVPRAGRAAAAAKAERQAAVRCVVLDRDLSQALGSRVRAPR